MFDPLEAALWEAWKRVRTKLAKDPAEVRRRLARRAAPTMRRPVRVWCLAVRANDLRIERMWLNHHRQRSKQEVTLDSESLRELCAPVRIAHPGEPLPDVAAKLGVRPLHLKTARLRGVFRTHYFYGPHKPRPLLYSAERLDPNAQEFVAGDEAWGWTRWIADWRVPDGICQTLTRIPCYYNRNSIYHDPADVLVIEPRKQKKAKQPLKQLPKPPPDPVWYKWKGDQYIGCDWRNPYALQCHLRKERAREKENATRRARWRETGGRRGGAGSLPFRGWRWLCPKCGETVRLLFYPLAEINLLKNCTAEFLKRLGIEAPVEAIKGAGGFACARCHRVQQFTRTRNTYWNDVVARLSGCMLYGAEVPRPADWGRRRIARVEHRLQRPAHEREAVLPLLFEGLGYKQIAERLNVSENVITNHVKAIYALHHVRGGRRVLAKKLGVKLKLTRRDISDRKRDRLGRLLRQKRGPSPQPSPGVPGEGGKRREKVGSCA